MSYDYARLGTTCCTSMSVLLSNAKYISLDDPVYKMYYTQTQRLPGYVPVKETPRDESETPKKTEKQECCAK